MLRKTNSFRMDERRPNLLSRFVTMRDKTVIAMLERTPQKAGIGMQAGIGQSTMIRLKPKKEMCRDGRCIRTPPYISPGLIGYWQ
jgi:hypothetical protein